MIRKFIRGFMHDNRGLETMEIVVVGAIILGIMVATIVGVENKVQSSGATENTAITNCVPDGVLATNLDTCVP
jgi:hypothetical protein